MADWVLAALIVAGLTVVCVVHVDRAVALRAAEWHFLRASYARAALAMPVMVVAAVLAVVVGLGHLVARKPMPRAVEAGMLAGWVVMACICLVELALKPLFGRTLPYQFLWQGLYAFDWFHGKIIESGFPSGHSSQAAAILTVLWAYYPRWRPLYHAAMAALAVALVLGQWHFVSDVLVGAFIGSAMAALTIRLWQRFDWRPR